MWWMVWSKSDVPWHLDDVIGAPSDQSTPGMRLHFLLHPGRLDIVQWTLNLLIILAIVVTGKWSWLEMVIVFNTDMDQYILLYELLGQLSPLLSVVHVRCDAHNDGKLHSSMFFHLQIDWMAGESLKALGIMIKHLYNNNAKINSISQTSPWYSSIPFEYLCEINNFLSPFFIGLTYHKL